MNYKKYLKYSLLIIISILFITLVLYNKNNISGKIYINEVNFQNNESNDWIELYNSSLNNKNLKWMYLSDDKKDFKKFKIKEDLIINSKWFLLTFVASLIVEWLFILASLIFIDWLTLIKKLNLEFVTEKKTVIRSLHAITNFDTLDTRVRYVV